MRRRSGCERCRRQCASRRRSGGQPSDEQGGRGRGGGRRQRLIHYLHLVHNNNTVEVPFISVLDQVPSMPHKDLASAAPIRVCMDAVSLAARRCPHSSQHRSSGDAQSAFGMFAAPSDRSLVCDSEPTPSPIPLSDSDHPSQIASTLPSLWQLLCRQHRCSGAAKCRDREIPAQPTTAVTTPQSGSTRRRLPALVAELQPGSESLAPNSASAVGRPARETGMTCAFLGMLHARPLLYSSSPQRLRSRCSHHRLCYTTCRSLTKPQPMTLVPKPIVLTVVLRRHQKTPSTAFGYARRPVRDPNSPNKTTHEPSPRKEPRPRTHS